MLACASLVLVFEKRSIKADEQRCQERRGLVIRQKHRVSYCPSFQQILDVCCAGNSEETIPRMTERYFCIKIPLITQGDSLVLADFYTYITTLAKPS